MDDLKLHEIDLEPCPHCGGVGIIEEEAGWCFYTACLDCGAHTAEVAYKTSADGDGDSRETAAKKAAGLWNNGKVLRADPGE